MGLVDDQFSALKAEYPEARCSRRGDGTYLVEIPGFRLPGGWNTAETTVSFVVPVGYPMARPDTFWTDAHLRLANGTPPANTNHNTNYGGPEPRLWFSYHPQSWNPSLDDLRTYVRIIRRRLHQVQ